MAFDDLKSSGRGYQRKFIAPFIRLGKRLWSGFIGLVHGIGNILRHLKALWPRIVGSLANFGKAYAESMTASETAARRLRQEKRRAERHSAAKSGERGKEKRRDKQPTNH